MLVTGVTSTVKSMIGTASKENLEDAENLAILNLIRNGYLPGGVSFDHLQHSFRKEFYLSASQGGKLLTLSKRPAELVGMMQIFWKEDKNTKSIIEANKAYKDLINSNIEFIIAQIEEYMKVRAFGEAVDVAAEIITS